MLLDAGWDKALCDEVWVAYVPRGVAHARLMARNSLSAENADKRIDAQKPPEFFLAHATVAFNTDKPLFEMKDEVLAAYHRVSKS